MKSLHCYEPDVLQRKLVPLLLHMTTKEEMDMTEGNIPPFHSHGILILLQIMGFGDLYLMSIVNTLLQFKPYSLRNLLSDREGSVLADIIMASPTILSADRAGLVKSLKVC